MKYKNIPDLYIVKGKIVFRKHVTKNGQNFNIWKTIGHPEDFTEAELRKIVSELRRKAYENVMNSSSSTVSRNLIEEKVKRKTIRLKYQKEISESGEEEPSLGEIMEKFFRWYRAVRKRSTYEVKFRRSRNLLRFFGKDFTFAEIGMKEVEEYKVWRLNNGADKNTVNKDLRLLSTIINRAVEFEWISHHRLYRKSILIKGIKNERTRYLSEEERRLIEVLESGKNRVLRDIVTIALHTGMRLGEILNLKWENVDLKNKVILLSSEQTKSGRKLLYL